MKTFLISVSFFLLAGCSSNLKQLNIGDKFDKDTKIDSIVYLLVSPSRFAKANIVTYKGVCYNICVDSGSITYISTSDAKFLSPSGTYIGMRFDELKKKIPNLELEEVWGWAMYAKLPDGWNAGFGLPKEGDMDTIVNIKDSARISWFFKK